MLTPISPLSGKVRLSQGPDANPRSMYSTTNSLAHDMKFLARPVPLEKAWVVATGFGRNNVETKQPSSEEARGCLQGETHRNFAPNASLYGERVDATTGPLVDRAAFSVARAKRNGTGFKSNFQPAGSQSLPSTPLTTTNRQAYVSHQSQDGAIPTTNDLAATRVPFCGALNNRSNTMLFVPNDGWRPTTEYGNQYIDPAALPDQLLADRKGPPTADSLGQIRPIGIPVIDNIRQKIMNAGGFHRVSECLRNHAVQGELGQDELGAGLFDAGVEISLADQASLLYYFDRDQTGRARVSEVLAGLRGPIGDH